MNFSDVINAQLQRMRMSSYDLVQLCKGEIPESTLYGFLNGKLTINSDRLAIIFDKLGLKISYR